MAAMVQPGGRGAFWSVVRRHSCSAARGRQAAGFEVCGEGQALLGVSARHDFQPPLAPGWTLCLSETDDTCREHTQVSASPGARSGSSQGSQSSLQTPESQRSSAGLAQPVSVQAGMQTLHKSLAFLQPCFWGQ